jgi:hypothetical protein
MSQKNGFESMRQTRKQDEQRLAEPPRQLICEGRSSRRTSLLLATLRFACFVAIMFLDTCFQCLDVKFLFLSDVSSPSRRPHQVCAQISPKRLVVSGSFSHSFSIYLKRVEPGRFPLRFETELSSKLVPKDEMDSVCHSHNTVATSYCGCLIFPTSFIWK